LKDSVVERTIRAGEAIIDAMADLVKIIEEVVGEEE
jgi:hypothetical protein